MDTNTLCVKCAIGRHDIFIADDGNIYAKCTNSAITAVRDYMVDDIPKGEDSVGYQWKRADGKTIKLVLVMED